MELDPRDSARDCCTPKPTNTNGNPIDLCPHHPQTRNTQDLPVPLLQNRLVMMGFQNLSPLPSGQKSLLTEFLCYWLFPAPRKEGNNCFGGQPSPLSLYELSAISSQPRSSFAVIVFLAAAPIISGTALLRDAIKGVDISAILPLQDCCCRVQTTAKKPFPTKSYI